ncbi:BMP family ABC transporter substrate-binding protein [Lyngbya aestuarii]|uniref:BMP family ABC transporter substrate-binding protein n=1 Tax=Lyngbya aestuarii TaxID=118322 RepID=UPI00403D7491
MLIRFISGLTYRVFRKVRFRTLLLAPVASFVFAWLSVIYTPGETPTTPAVPESSSFKVAILLPNSRGDDPWSQSGYKGLKLIEKELGAQVAYTENLADLPPRGVEQAFRRYAKHGFNFIIGHGGEFNVAAETVAKEFPRTEFAIVGRYAGNNKNLGALGFRSGELGYLAGVVAGLKSETRKVVMIGSMPIPDIVEAGKLFERGAKAVDPRIKVSVKWINSFANPDKAEKIASAMVAAGADVLLGIAGAGDAAVVKVASEAGVHAIGWVQDLYKMAPNAILTSSLQKVPVVLLEGAMLVRQGRWEGKQYRFGLSEGAQTLAPFRGALTAKEEDMVNTVKKNILAGKIDVSP